MNKRYEYITNGKTKLQEVNEYIISKKGQEDLKKSMKEANVIIENLRQMKNSPVYNPTRSIAL